MQEEIDSKEMLRQLLHIFFGSVFIASVVLFGMSATLYFLIAIFLIGAVISFLIMKGSNVPIFSQIVETIGRGSEKELPGQGALFFFLGAIILMALFNEQHIVVGALIVSVYGDGFSTIIGKTFGRKKLPNNKTLEGSMAGIIVSALLLGLLFPPHAAIATAVIGMLAELLPIDDNLTIPVVSAVVLKFF